jgi:sec-independent protein translocase protein TatA
MFGGFGATELFIVLAIVLVLFGGKKLKSLGGDLGGAISEFKNSLNKEDEEEEEIESNSAASTATENKETIKEAINE